MCTYFSWRIPPYLKVYKGSSADPATFMNNKEIMLSEDFSKIKNLLFFLSTPYEWMFYFLILILAFHVYSRNGRGER